MNKAQVFIITFLVFFCQVGKSKRRDCFVDSSCVYIVNNGELDLQVNNVIVPAGRSLKESHPIPVYEKKLIISLPKFSRNLALGRVHLKDQDVSSTIKIGAYFDTEKKVVHVMLLKANKIPIMITLHPKDKKMRIPHQLEVEKAKII